MIKLILDSGNTSLKAAFCKGKRMIRLYRDTSFAFLQQKNILQQYGQPGAIIFSSVGRHRKLPRQLTKGATVVIGLEPGIRLPFRIRYKTPETLGNDRIANAAGARAVFPGKPVLVIDAGTCLKFDFVDSRGDYIGGSIAPGLRMRFDALHRFTARLPALTFTGKTMLTGMSTRDSMIAGVQTGILAETACMIELYKARHKGLKVILTGGDWRFFESNLKNHIFASPNLTLSGLNEILDHHLSC